MFSTVAWFVATMVLLTTALPRPPLDGSIHLRPDKTGILIRRTDDPLSDHGERRPLAQEGYMTCLANWAAADSRSVKKNKGKLSPEQELTSFVEAERLCYEEATAKGRVYVKRLSKQDVDDIIAALRKVADAFPTEPSRSRGKFINPDDTRGKGFGPNVKRMTLIRPPDGFGIHGLLSRMGSYLLGDGQRRRPGIGSPVPRPMLVAPM